MQMRSGLESRTWPFTGMYRTDTAKSSKKPHPYLLAVQTTNKLIVERLKKQTPKVDDDKPF